MILSKPFAFNPSRLYLAQCVLFLAALVLAFMWTSPYFLSLNNLSNILSASAVIGLMAIGGTFVIASGALDLSTAAVMAFCSTLCAFGLQHLDWSLWLIMALAVGAGGLCGLMTGLLINLTKAPSFIVTLGMLSVVRGVAYLISHGVPIYGLSDDVMTIGQAQLFGLPLAVFVLLLGTCMGVVLLKQTRFGAHTLTLGDNPQAALAMGIPVARLNLKVFTLAGIFSGLAGILFMLRTNAGDPAAGQNYELMAITAVILGGSNLFGGRATIIGTFLGVMCLGVLQNGLNLLAVSTYYQVLFIGLVLLGAASLSRIGYRR